MESVLFLGKVSSCPIRVPNYSDLSSLQQKTKPHFSFSKQTSLSLSVGNSRQCSPLRTAFRPAIQAIERSSVPSGNNRNGNDFARNAIRASITLAWVLGIIGAGLKMNPKAIAGPRERAQKAPQVVAITPAYPLGGRYALKSLLDVNAYLATSRVDPPRPPSRLPERPSTENINDMKMNAVRLMKYGKPEEAVCFLQSAYKFYENDVEPAYNVAMALVEILICQGKYTEALQCCNYFKEEQYLPSDARIPLYKGIIYTMLDQRDEAKKWWEKYVETIDADLIDPRKF